MDMFVQPIPHIIPGDVIKERYRMEKLLGSGGFGSVYLGWDQSLEIPVALKVLHENSFTAVDQFHKEGKILARLNHAGLPRVTDFFSELNNQFLVMDFIEGEDMEGIIRKRNGISDMDKTLDWFEQLLKILNYIHGKDIVHRDIKPSNIKITPHNKVVLVDFGIAKVGSSRMTSPGAKGAFTPAMASPEQCATYDRTTAWSDIYSVGATMYYCFTGKLPTDAMRRVMGEDLPAPTVFNRNIPASLEKVMLKAMELKPERRFSSSEEMRSQIENIKSNPARPEPSPSSPATPQFRRDIRRK